MPCFRASRWSSTAPTSEPWSVSVTAGIPSSAARAARAGIRQAPSRIEYSEWTWRWTKSASGTGRAIVQLDPDAPSARVGAGQLRGGEDVTLERLVEAEPPVARAGL